jgi:hypothetical protein
MAMMPTIFLLFCKRLGLVSAAVLTTLVLVETLLSIFSSKPQLAFEWVLDEVHQNHRVFDEETLFTRPRYLDKTYFTSRSSPLTILALGDSFTEKSRDLGTSEVKFWKSEAREMA